MEIFNTDSAAKLEAKVHLWRLKNRWKQNIKMLEKFISEVLCWAYLSQDVFVRLSALSVIRLCVR
jgi:hypothetical protein